MSSHKILRSTDNGHNHSVSALLILDVKAETHVVGGNGTKVSLAHLCCHSGSNTIFNVMPARAPKLGSDFFTGLVLMDVMRMERGAHYMVYQGSITGRLFWS